MKPYDLHCHTTASDGELTPTELVDFAIKKGLRGIAVTDHDTIDGIHEAMEYSKKKNIEVVPGIEISCDCEKRVKEVHIVGLFIDNNNLKLKEIKEINRKNGIKKAKEIIGKLKLLNYEIDFSELERKRRFDKPFIATLLLKKYPDDFENKKDVFNKVLGWKKPAMVYGGGLSIKEAINRIHNAGGIAIIAHPGQLREHDDYFIKKFIKLGGDGIEVGNKYPYLKNSEELNLKYKKLVKENNLLVSGGVDFHEEKGWKELGNSGINKEEFEAIKGFRKEYRKRM